MVKIYRITKVVFLSLVVILALFSLKVSANDIEIKFQSYFENNLFSLNNIDKGDFLSIGEFNFNGIENIKSESINYGWEQKYSISIGSFPLQCGYLKKYYRDVYVNEDTIKFISDLESDSMKKENYTFYLINSEELVEGLFIGGEIYKNQKQNISVNFYGKLLRGIDLHSSYYNCLIEVTDENMVIDGVRDSVYSSVGKNELYKANFHSHGYSFDCLVNWEIGADKELVMSIEDLYSRIYWYDVYSMLGRYNTDNIKEDLDGYFYYEPVFKGHFFFEDYITSFTPEINLNYHDNQLNCGLLYKGTVYPYFDLLVLNQPIYNKMLKINLGFTGSNYSCNLKYSGINIDLQFDELDIKESKNFMLHMGLNISF